MKMGSVLIADDDDDTLEMLSVILEGHKFETLCVTNGFEAIKTAKRHLPRSIILDVGLPEINGFDVTTQLRESPDLVDSTIIGFSGYVNEFLVDRASEVGMDYYLAKPANLDILLACLKFKKETKTIEPDELEEWCVETRAIGDEIRNRVSVLSVRSKVAVARAKEICTRYQGTFGREDSASR
jgi:CheY-like chemotaxis protein